MHQGNELEKARKVIVDVFKRKRHEVASTIISLVLRQNYVAHRQHLMAVSRGVVNAWFHNRQAKRCPFGIETCKRVFKERAMVARELEEMRLKRWSIHGLY